MAVECYLERGKPFRAAISSTQGFFAPISVPDIKNAKVIIIGESRTDTLSYSVVVEQNKMFNYNSIALVDTGLNSIYRLVVIDSVGKKITATTQFLANPKLNAISWNYDTDSNAALTIYVADNPLTEDYYRVLVNKDSINSESKATFLYVDNTSVNPGTLEASLVTSHRFSKGDSVIVRVYALSKEYYSFLNSVELAKQVNGNPFVQPAQVVSNIMGGFGIFTSLQYVQKSVRIK
jgi:hypothetical protein